MPNDSAFLPFKEFVSNFRDNCASGFIVLLTRVVNGTSLKKNLSTDKWIMKIWHINTIKFNSARDKDRLTNFAN